MTNYYGVGSQCFATKASATDYQMSLVVPTITADGKLMHPIKKNGVWMYNGQTVNLHFADCDPSKDFAQGAEIAGAIVILLTVAYLCKFLKRFIEQNMIKNDEREY